MQNANAEKHVVHKAVMERYSGWTDNCPSCASTGILHVWVESALYTTLTNVRVLVVSYKLDTELSKLMLCQK